MSKKSVDQKNGFIIGQPLTNLFLVERETIEGHLISFWSNQPQVAKVFIKKDWTKKVAIELLHQMRTGASLAILQVKRTEEALEMREVVEHLGIFEGVIKNAND